jgi:hypothetical protein
MADRQTLPRASPGTAIPVVVIVFPAIFAPMYAIRSDIIYLPRAGVFLGRVDRMQRAG